MNGVDVFLEQPRDYTGLDQIGLITNQTGVTIHLESTLDAFYGHPDIKLRAVFGPEHGARGDVQDALDVPSQVDPYTSLPIYCLYGDHRAPTESMLDGVDTLVYDIQDCGTRYYTYISTLTLCMQSAEKHGVKMLVLDRPNPLNGVRIEGNILEDGFKSFVGLHSIPIRHGLTTGELAYFINTSIKCDLSVVTMKGWTRTKWFDETELPWVSPSPNLPSLDAATVYPGTCLFEGVNVSEGRGTTKPFEVLGAPWIDAREWVGAIKELKLSGVRFRRCCFTPIHFRYINEKCNGIQVHVSNRNQFKPVETGLHLLSTLLETHPEEFKFNEPTYDARRHFDLLIGTDKLREQLERGEPVENIIASWQSDIYTYLEAREHHLLYKEADF